MLDFKELKPDGNDLELLVREILLIKGFKVQWSGKGPDGGKDLICFEERNSEFHSDKKIWLIQCKHKAHANISVGISDLDDIVDSCNQHGAQGYLLVCSTYPSSAVINRLEGITNNQSNNISATYWDATIIEQKISTPDLWKIAQTFFPESSKNETWQIFATENPNHWIVNYRGYHFHLSNRIGSEGKYHFKSIEHRVNDIQKIKLPKDHFIRIRAVYFDDKNGDYTWYIDYMYPNDKNPKITTFEIAYLLGHESVLEDGQYYYFDVIRRPYFKYSDHYDKDHYDYYRPYIYNYRYGQNREIKDPFTKESLKSWEKIKELEGINCNVEFNKLVKNLNKIKFIKIVNAVNCDIEKIDKFLFHRDWSDIMEIYNINSDNFFSTWFLIDVGKNEDKFLELISYLPQEGDAMFRLTKVYIYTPNDEDTGSVFESEDDSLFELSLKIHPNVIHTKVIGRQVLNAYFRNCYISIDKYLIEKDLKKI